MLTNTADVDTVDRVANGLSGKHRLFIDLGKKA